MFLTRSYEITLSIRSNTYVCIVPVSSQKTIKNLHFILLSKTMQFDQGRIQEFVQGGLKFFYLSRGARHPMGSEINRFHCSLV